MLKEQEAELEKLRSVQKELQGKMASIKEVLGMDQLKRINTNMRAQSHWSDDTFIKALDLIGLGGFKGYRHLLNMGLPFPSERCVQKQMQEAKVHLPDLMKKNEKNEN